jgi:hypothetical protein
LSAARVFDVDNRLAKVLCNLGGEVAAKLIAQAEAEVAKLHALIRAYVSEEVAAILIYSGAGDDVLLADCERLCRHALNVAEVAGAAELTGLGEVAGGINALIENLKSTGLWHTEALRLHLRAMMLLSQDAIDPAGEGVVLEQLRTMRRAIGVQE